MTDILIERWQSIEKFWVWRKLPLKFTLLPHSPTSKSTFANVMANLFNSLEHRTLDKVIIKHTAQSHIWFAPHDVLSSKSVSRRPKKSRKSCPRVSFLENTQKPYFRRSEWLMISVDVILRHLLGVVSVKRRGMRQFSLRPMYFPRPWQFSIDKICWWADTRLIVVFSGTVLYE